MSRTLTGILLALAAVSMFSTSALLVRLSAPVPSVQVTFWRLLLGGALVLLAARASGQTARVGRLRIGRLALYGLVAGLHFLCYIAALSFTTVANTLTLVYTSPAFVAAFSALFLREPVRRRQVTGIAVVILGISILTGFDLSADPRRVVGDALSLGSAAAFGLYSVAGRGEAGRYPLLVYAGWVYLFGALWILPLAATGFDPARYNGSDTAAIIALAVVPLGIGHTLYNAALRRVHAPKANVLSTLEVVGGSLLAWVFLGERIGSGEAAGILIVMAGTLAVIL